MKLKVCGMKFIENIQEVAALQPDYLGFIFYEKSKRNFTEKIPELPSTIKKVGVFVNESIDVVFSTIKKHQLQAIQLHGDEPVSYLQELKALLPNIEIIKVFGIKEHFNFQILTPFEPLVDYFLFDTKGKERGGNGYTFDWTILKNYPSTKPFFLSGGIGLDEVEDITKIRKTALPIYALDVNSKFEIEAGLKNTSQIKKFKTQLGFS